LAYTQDRAGPGTRGTGGRRSPILCEGSLNDVGTDTSKLRVDNLVFEVFDRPVHPEWFGSRIHQRIQQTAWTCDLHLFAGGHAVIWGARQVRVSEILGVFDPPLPDNRRLYSSRVDEERVTQIALGQGITYQTCFESEQVERAVFAHLYDEILADSRRTGLLYQATTKNRLSPPALAYLRHEATDHSLSVHATHFIPGDLAIVRVQTLFEIE